MAWLMRSSRYFMDPSGQVPAAKLPRFRRSVYWFLLALNRALTAVLGFGLEKFATSETSQTLAAPDVKLLAPDAAAEGKSCRCLPMDQCSIGWSAA